MQVASALPYLDPGSCGWLLFWLSRAGIASREQGSFGAELHAGA